MNDDLSTERRYDEAEIAEIMRLAADAQDAQQASIGPQRGLTLAELQQVASEVGLRPELIGQAAGMVRASTARTASTTVLGLPLATSRNTELARTLTDQEWDQLVVLLRETFGATGTVRRDGGLRQWKNGNLTAVLEPAGSSQRLRLSTRKGNAAATAMLGAITALAGGFLLAASPEAPLIGSAMLVGGACLFGSLWFTLPAWARLRASQMETVAARAGELARAPAP